MKIYLRFSSKKFAPSAILIDLFSRLKYCNKSVVRSIPWSTSILKTLLSLILSLCVPSSCKSPFKNHRFYEIQFCLKDPIGTSVRFLLVPHQGPRSQLNYSLQMPGSLTLPRPKLESTNISVMNLTFPFQKLQPKFKFKLLSTKNLKFPYSRFVPAQKYQIID